MRNRYYLPLKTAALSVLSIVAVVSAGGSVNGYVRVNADSPKKQSVRPADEINNVHEQMIRFAADYGVADPTALVAAVRHSPMASLLISVAIEESRGDPVAVGSAGERGAWQVKACDWGAVPRDIHAQADQAERIIRLLLANSKGSRKKALARYNGGTTPPGKSYRYAERVLKRANHLQVAADRRRHTNNTFRSALLDIPGSTWMVSSFFKAGTASSAASVSS